MDGIVSSDLVQNFKLLIPVMVCVVIAILIRRTDGNIIVGFSTLPEEKKRELREKGYVEKNSNDTGDDSPIISEFCVELCD